MKTIISGSRSITDYKMFCNVMKEVPWKITHVISGGANGIDDLSIKWSKENKIPCTIVKANWKITDQVSGDIIIDKQAGHKRNAKMSRMTDHLVSVWDGVSSGSRNMVDLMRRKNGIIFQKIITETHIKTNQRSGQKTFIPQKINLPVIDSFSGKYHFLSNFYPAPIFIRQVEYSSSEHYFQSQKTTNKSERKKIMEAPTCGIARKLGRECTMRPGWNSLKNKVMLFVVRKKFNTSKWLKESLIKTGDSILIEGNTWHDNHFGNCTCESCRNIEGKNILGKILMKVRKELQDEKDF